MNSANAELETSQSILLSWATKVQILKSNPICTSPEEVLAQNLAAFLASGVPGVFVPRSVPFPPGRRPVAQARAPLKPGRRSSPGAAQARAPGVRSGERRAFARSLGFAEPEVWGCKAFIQTTASSQDLDACLAHPWRTFLMHRAKAHDYLFCNLI